MTVKSVEDFFNLSHFFFTLKIKIMYMPFAGSYDMLISDNSASMKKLSAIIKKGYQQVGKTWKALNALKPLRSAQA